MLRRTEAAQARTDTRDWAKARRARTRELIELGGLVQKCGLPERIAAMEPDTRAVVFGALLELVSQIGQGESETAARAQVMRWRDRGRAAFRSETKPERADTQVSPESAGQDPALAAHEA